MKKQHHFGSTFEAIAYPALLLVLIWLVFWADKLFPAFHFYQLGVRPKEISSLKGILLMPLIHSPRGFEHIVNNSVPIVVLLGTLIFYYREIAGKVFLFSWIFTGIGVWLFATNTNSYHIGISGIIYALAGFLFISGVLRKYLPLQAISLFVVFVYGSLIWGIFPMKPQVSWEGHLSGLIVGVILAVIYRKKGVQRPKYLYEIEKEMGIEPPDFEAELNEKIRLAKEREAEKERMEKGYTIVYHYQPEKETHKETSGR